MVMDQIEKCVECEENNEIVRRSKGRRRQIKKSPFKYLERWEQILEKRGTSQFFEESSDKGANRRTSSILGITEPKRKVELESKEYSKSLNNLYETVLLGSIFLKGTLKVNDDNQKEELIEEIFHFDNFNENTDKFKPRIVGYIVSFESLSFALINAFYLFFF